VSAYPTFVFFHGQEEVARLLGANIIKFEAALINLLEREDDV
jgi:hypothetical protein